MELKDYLGILLCQITEARQSADLKSIEVAKSYLDNEYLKHFPIPRMRIDNIELNIPIAVSTVKFDNIEPEISGKRELQSETYKMIKTEYEAQGNKINQKQYRTVIKEISKEMDSLSNAISKGGNNNDALKTYKNSIKLIGEKHLKTALELKDLTDVVKNEIKPNEACLGKLEIIAESAILKELQSSNSLINIKMTINEEGMEWIEETDGKEKKTYLLPE